MKRITKFLFLALAIVGLGLAAGCTLTIGGAELSEGNPPPNVGSNAEVSAPANTLEGSIIAFATPLLVWGIRFFAPKIPKPWIPIIAGVCGFLIDQALPWLGAGLQSTGYGFIAGLAGVGVRELKKQITDRQGS